MKEQIKRAAGFIVQAPSKKFLWIQRAELINNPNQWTPIVGGQQEKGEPLLKTARREFFEETGYKEIYHIKKLCRFSTKRGFYLVFFAKAREEFEINLKLKSIRKEVKDYKWTKLYPNLEPKHSRFDGQFLLIKRSLLSLGVL